MLPDDVGVTTRTVDLGEGPLGVAVLEPPVPGPRTFVAAMGYAASLDPFELQRFRLLAHVLGARLVVVETPGCGVRGSRLTAAERWALLRRSDFRPAAGRMLAAAAAADPAAGAAIDASGAGLGIVGYSLGCSLGTAMAREAGARAGAAASALVLVEPVAARRWSSRTLLTATRAEDGLVDAALADNADVVDAVEPWDRRPEDTSAPHRNRLDMLLLAGALRSGGLPDEVAAAGAGRLVVVHGRDSRYGLTEAGAALTARARAAGARADQLEVAGTHALWHSLPAVERIGRFVRDALGDAG
ncbi:hypothetical protein [Cellulomonas composti]|nr:hypothetical protein [Cellulomonas composti]